MTTATAVWSDASDFLFRGSLSEEQVVEQEALATFGGGCFWCTEAIFQRIKGVLFVESGYSGGTEVDPTYDQVVSGQTGHAEVVQVSYDPEIISYLDLVKLHLATHDPTTLDAQGTDYGPQYRSVVFYRNEEERHAVEGFIESLSLTCSAEIVTQVVHLEHFYPAEEDHRNFYNEHSKNDYCQVVIEPKLDFLQDVFGMFFNRDG